jgi:phage gpG-like protein
MSGVTFSIQQQSDKKVVLYLSEITPRIFVNIKQALKLWGYQGANVSITKYFAGGQSVERGSRNTGSLLVSRTGTLTRSIAASVAPGYSETETTATQVWGSATPYGRIQEYGGNAGRNHKSYIPPRPYLAPAQQDTLPDLIESIKAAVQAAIST